MVALKNSWKLIMLFLLLTGYFQISAQVSSVNNYLSKVNGEVSQINQLANNKQVYEAIEQLNETRRDLDRYVNYYLEDEMRKAKAENSGFAPTLNVSFSTVLTASYWEDRVKQAQKSIDLAESAYSERNYQRTLDSQDEVWSYLKTVYGVGKTIKDVIQNVEQAKFYDAIKSAKEGVDGFIDDYIKIEEARLQIINTGLYETNVRGLIQKGKRMEESCWQFSSFMRAYEQDVNDFYQIVNRLNQKISEISNETVIDLSSAEYSWNSQKYLNQINAAANQFKAGNGNYESIEALIEAINEKAEADKDQVSQNLYNSGATTAFDKVNKLEEDFNEFYDLSIDVLDECYRFDQNREEEQITNNNQISTGQTIDASSDGINGIDKNKYLNRLHEAGKEYQNGEISQSDFIKKRWRKIADDYNQECRLFEGTYKSKKEANDAGVAQQQFTREMLNIVNAYCNEEPLPIVEDAVSTSTITSTSITNGASKPDVASSNISALANTTPGKRIPNKLYHSYWSYDNISTIQLKQNGNTVEIVGKGTGQIINSTLIYSYKDSNGFLLKDEYHLFSDGYTMEVKKQRSDNELKSEMAIGQNIFSPTTQQLDDYRAKYGYEISIYGYNGLKRAGFGQSKMEFSDSDSDQVPNECDKCPNTPAGLTVDNGGVDIAGCPIGQNVPSNTETTNIASNNSQQPKTNISTPATTSNAFVGAGASTNQSNTTNKNITPQTRTVSTTNPVSPPGLVGTVSNDGNGKGTYCSLDLKTVKNTDIIVFNQLLGKLDKVEVIWRTSGGVWRTQYEGTRTNFKVSEFFNNIPKDITHFNFTVNAHHNASYTPNACTMEVWHLPAGGKIPPRQQLANSDSGDDKLTNDFNELIKKADEAFNKKYWNETQGSRASSNPKQESLDLLRKAEQLIGQQQDVNKRYSMVLRLSSKYSEYAKRVFANSAKDDFIQSCGSLLSKYGNLANSVSEPKIKSTAYNKVADGWRELTKVAMWGSHQYNKAACDVEAKKYYDLALREDRNNTQLQKTVEKINAPKKAVPAAVAATKTIPESSWAKAENLRNMIAENIPIQHDDQAHPIEIGLMKVDMGSINTGSGKVWVLRMGSADWELLTKTDEYIFPGDKIKTDDDAKNVSFNYSADKTNLAILPGSIVTFEEQQLYIERGNIYVRVIKSGNEFLIITPKATTGCRGTEFTINVDNSGTTDVHLYEGVIEMRNSTEISYLVPGQTAKVEKVDDEINVAQFNIQQHKQQFLSNQNQSKTANQSNPFRFVSGGGKIVGGN